MKEKVIVAMIGLGTAGVVGAAGYLGHKVHKLTRKVGMAMEDLSQAEAREIGREMIERSVEKAAEKEVRRAVRDASNDALDAVRGEVKAQVRTAVNGAFDDLRKAVEDEVAAQVAAIDHQALKKTVTEKAQKKILEKFDGELDDILHEFSDNLARVKKIYSSISDTLSERPSGGKEISFKVG